MNKKLKFKENFKYLIFWPVFIAWFFAVDALMTDVHYHQVHCFVDDLIPFNEFFIIPYMTWHPLIVLVLAYTLVNETDNFRNLMKFFILTFTVTMVIYMVYPTCLELRPEVFPRENIFTEAVKLLYFIDTPANVCPSLHIIGSLGLLFASWDTRGKDSIPKKIFMALAVAFICLSTMVLKQHSLVDIIVAMPISFVGWVICFRGKEIERIERQISEDMSRNS